MPLKAAQNHAPVLVEEVLRYLAVQPGGRYVDCTVGGGGHAEEILNASAPGGVLLGIDADPAALDIARARLEPFAGSVRLTRGNFRDLSEICRDAGFVPVHGVLFDLGISSHQLADETRGFSFQVETPLDMRFSKTQELTANDIVNTYSESALADVIWRYGEEPASRRIARTIASSRPIGTTTQLAEAVARAVGRGEGGRRRIHPATRTFQAIRIAVNDELGALGAALEQSLEVLGRGGHLVVVSFHSLEDRIVKQFIQREAHDCICPPEQPSCTCAHSARLRPLLKGTVRPSPEEVSANRRSRSARLRAAERI